MAKVRPLAVGVLAFLAACAVGYWVWAPLGSIAVIVAGIYIIVKVRSPYYGDFGGSDGGAGC